MEGIRIIKRIWKILIGLLLLWILPGLLVTKKIGWMISVILGVLIGVLAFYQLSTGMEKASYLSQEKANSYIFSQYVLRYILYGIVLFLSVRIEGLYILGTALGLITIKLGILIQYGRKG